MKTTQLLGCAVGFVAIVLGGCSSKEEDGALDREGKECLFNNIERACGEDDRGLQYCSFDEHNDLVWGPCHDVSDLECMPGEVLDCPDMGPDKICTVKDWTPTFGECGRDTDDEGPYTGTGDG